MDAPEELQWAVAEALFDASDDLRPKDNWPDDDAKYGRAAAAVLAVPVVRDALARDAKVAEIVGDFPYGATSSQMVALAEEVLDVHRWTAP